MAKARVRNLSDTGWIEIGGGVEIYQGASPPAETFPGQLWLDTDEETGVDGIGLEFDSGIIGLKDNWILFSNKTGPATGGGTATAGAWYTCPINTEEHDPNGWGSLASNQMTLVAGTYRLYAYQQMMATNYSQIRLRNITDNTTTWTSSMVYNNSAQYGASKPTMVGIFTITAQKTFQLQYRCQATLATNGLGGTTTQNYGEDVRHAIVRFERIA